MNLLENIETTKGHVVEAVEKWANNIIDDFSNRFHIVPLAPYIKRGVKNHMAQKSDNISGMLKDAAMFVCDENGNCDIETVTDDLLTMLRTMKPVPLPFLNGMVGGGKITFSLPTLPIITPLLGGPTEITINEQDLVELRRILIEELVNNR